MSEKKLTLVMLFRNEWIRLIRLIVSEPVGGKNPGAFYLRSTLKSFT